MRGAFDAQFVEERCFEGVSQHDVLNAEEAHVTLPPGRVLEIMAVVTVTHTGQEDILTGITLGPHAVGDVPVDIALVLSLGEGKNLQIVNHARRMRYSLEADTEVEAFVSRIDTIRRRFRIIRITDCREVVGIDYSVAIDTVYLMSPGLHIESEFGNGVLAQQLAAGVEVLGGIEPFGN